MRAAPRFAARAAEAIAVVALFSGCALVSHAPYALTPVPETAAPSPPAVPAEKAPPPQTVEPEAAPQAETTPTFDARALASIPWQDAPQLGPGALSFNVDGDPAKGPFLLLMKLPAGTRIEPHWHSRVEVGTVLAGRVLTGTGERIDESAATAFGPGDHFRIPPRVPHWGVVVTDAVVLRYSDGPRDITYVGVSVTRP